MEDSGEFGVIFSSLANDKWSLTLNSRGSWSLKNNKTTLNSGFIKLSGERLKLKIKKKKKQFEFKVDEQTLLTYTIDNVPGNYFGFQVENNLQGSRWIVEKYKLSSY